MAHDDCCGGNGEHKHEHGEGGCGCGDNCNCNHDYDHEEVEIITLTTDLGEDVDCQVIDVIAFKDNHYMVLLILEEDELLFSEYKEEGEEFVLTPIESDDLYEEIAEYYWSLFGDDEE